MKPGELDLSEPIIKVWRDPDETERPWRFSVWYNQRWFPFPEVAFKTKARASQIARKTLEAMQERANFKTL